MSLERASEKILLKRGTKQGDPISSTLFNAVLESAMRPLKHRWTNLGYGIDMGNGEFLQNARFADDVLLVGTSMQQIREMLVNIRDKAAEIGLELHMGKT